MLFNNKLKPVGIRAMNFLALLCVIVTYGKIAISQPTLGIMPALTLPSSSWNTHTHCFDPERHPFKTSRTYTPQAALLNDLVGKSPADNIMIVQATIEDGYSGLVETLANSHRLYPGKRILGTIFWDPDDPSLKNMTESEWDALHNVGVRSVRIHGSYGGSGDDLNWVLEQFLQVASHCPLKRHNWSISAQLPLATWSMMKDAILNHPKLKKLSIVADHNGSATPSDFDTAEFNDFVDILGTGRFYVKLGALHRRSDDITLMEPFVKAYAKAGPNGIVWGSDWPHVNTTVKGLDPTPPLEVDTSKELRLIRGWLTEEQWKRMLVYNPARVFDVGQK
ncbi:hypothetical protein ACLX1H_004609 [Fusarium chlamydosporum]